MTDYYTIAVVEDDEDIRENVCAFLRKSGFQAWGAASAEDFYVALLRDKADLVVVDLGLPGEDGLSLVRRLVAQHVPVVVQTAWGDLEHRIAGLDAGALQYFVKPTDMGELAAGIRSQLRRVAAEAAPAPAPAPKAVPARWRLDEARAALLTPDQQLVRLTGQELLLLRCRMDAAGELVTKSSLQAVMGYGSQPGDYHRLESMLWRLRRKTLEATGLALPVRSVFGRGLMFTAD